MQLLVFLFLTACAMSAPVILVVLIGRNRIGRNVARSAVAVSFAAATAYALWHIEWFDVWRHGAPPLSVFMAYCGYLAAFGAIGWLLGDTILRARSASAPQVGPPNH